MPDQGEALGVDIFHLYKTAKNLREVAVIYRDSARLLSLSESSWLANAGESRSRPHPVAPEWETACAETTKVLEDTARNLDDTAHALDRTADDYAATDQAAAAEYKRLREADV